MTVEDALKFFEDIPAISDRVQTLMDVGLGYVKLGQSATTLSGGEAQRVKISSELYRPHLEKTMYLLDEPTVGLHYDDVQNLLHVLNKLIQKGNTVVLIEHNLDIIKNADYIIDIGPEGGTGGGEIVARGTPEEVANNKNSFTGKYLAKCCAKSKEACPVVSTLYCGVFEESIACPSVALLEERENKMRPNILWVACI